MKAQSAGMAAKAGWSLSLVTRFGCERIAQMGRSVAAAGRGSAAPQAARTRRAALRRLPLTLLLTQ